MMQEKKPNQKSFFISYYRRNNRRTQVGQTENGIIPRSPQNGEFDDFFLSYLIHDLHFFMFC